jgi:hypothetical protein
MNKKGVDDIEKTKPLDKYFGFIAQEVEAVFPELVSTDENGQKFVSYTEFIPLLVEAFKEQQQTITIMQEQIDFLRNEFSELKSAMISSTDEFEKTNDANTLFQNTPNPFLEETRIENPELMNESWKD